MSDGETYRLLDYQTRSRKRQLFKLSVVTLGLLFVTLGCILLGIGVHRDSIPDFQTNCTVVYCGYTPAKCETGCTDDYNLILCQTFVTYADTTYQYYATGLPMCGMFSEGITGCSVESQGGGDCSGSERMKKICGIYEGSVDSCPLCQIGDILPCWVSGLKPNEPYYTQQKVVNYLAMWISGLIILLAGLLIIALGILITTGCVPTISIGWKKI
jgi:hypothetical protein